MDNTFLAIVLLIGCFLLGLLIGWLIWGRKLKRVQESLDTAEKKLGERGNEVLSLRGQLSTLEAAAAAPDDLTQIEGIGPKIQELLQSIGIKTYPQLAAADVQKISDMLRGKGLAMTNPGTWPQQAKLAAEGAWEALEKLQDELKGGRQA